MERSIAKAADNCGAIVMRGAGYEESMEIGGFYEVECHGPDGKLKWRDTIKNLVTTEGRNALLTHALKGSAYTSTAFVGLVESTGFSAYNATNTMAGLTAAGGGSPTNGWNEATSAMCAARQAITLGTAAAGSLATSSASTHAILATCTIKGCFLALRSTAGVASVATVGSTAGALYSAGNFSGGDKALSNGDTLSVSYTATLT
jgi:hypothetical protein